MHGACLCIISVLIYLISVTFPLNAVPCVKQGLPATTPCIPSCWRRCSLMSVAPPLMYHRPPVITYNEASIIASVSAATAITAMFSASSSACWRMKPARHCCVCLHYQTLHFPCGTSNSRNLRHLSPLAVHLFQASSATFNRQDYIHLYLCYNLQH